MKMKTYLVPIYNYSQTEDFSVSSFSKYKCIKKGFGFPWGPIAQFSTFFLLWLNLTFLVHPKRQLLYSEGINKSRNPVYCLSCKINHFGYSLKEKKSQRNNGVLEKDMTSAARCVVFLNCASMEESLSVPYHDIRWASRSVLNTGDKLPSCSFTWYAFNASVCYNQGICEAAQMCPISFKLIRLCLCYEYGMVRSLTCQVYLIFRTRFSFGYCTLQTFLFWFQNSLGAAGKQQSWFMQGFGPSIDNLR